MKKSLIKKNIIPIALFGFSIIFPLFNYVNFFWYCIQVIFWSISFRLILTSLSYAKFKNIWGIFRVIGIILSVIFLFELISRLTLILDPKERFFIESSIPIDDERFVKYLFAFLTSLLVLGIGEIIIYLRDIRLLLSLNKNNKDYLKCDDCEGKGFIEKNNEDETNTEDCSNCSGLGFLEKNSNNWFSRT